MAIDIDSVLRRLQTRYPDFGVKTGVPSGTGLTGFSPTGGGGGGSQTGGLNPSYTPKSLGSFAEKVAPGLFGGIPNFSSVDDMTFDSEYSNKLNALQRQLSGAQFEFDEANRVDEEDYQRAIRDAQQQQEIDAASLLDRLANQGILRSGIQVKAQSDLADSYARRRSEYERTRNRARTDRESSLARTKGTVQDQIGLLQQQKAQREQERQEAIARRLAEQQAEAEATGFIKFHPGQDPTLPVRTIGMAQGIPLGSSRNRSFPESPTAVINIPQVRKRWGGK